MAKRKWIWARYMDKKLNKIITFKQEGHYRWPNELELMMGAEYKKNIWVPKKKKKKKRKK